MPLSKRTMLPPDVILELPAGWSERERGRRTLTFGPGEGEDGGGVLQMSSPSASPQWRGGDLDVLSRELARGGRLGDVLLTKPVDCRYGEAVCADLYSEHFRDVAQWIIMHETHDPLVVTWIAEEPTDDGRVARELVQRIAPGHFSAALSTIVSTVKGNVAQQGRVDAHAVFFHYAQALIETAYFDGMPDAIEREAMRLEATRPGVTVAARVGMFQLARANGAETFAFVHAESPTRKKRFAIPVAAPGQIAHEMPLDGVAIADFFVPPDPAVAAMLRAARDVR